MKTPQAPKRMCSIRFLQAERLDADDKLTLAAKKKRRKPGQARYSPPARPIARLTRPPARPGQAGHAGCVS